MYKILLIVAYVLIAFAAYFIAIYIDRKKHPHHGAEYVEDDELVLVLAIFWPTVLIMAAIFGPFILLKRLAINMAIPRKNYIKECFKEYES